MLPLFLLLASAQEPPAGSVEPEPAPFATALGPHFQVEARFASQLAAEQALAAAESVVAPIESVWGALPRQEDRKHAHPPRIVLYGSVNDFDAQWKARTGWEKPSAGDGACFAAPSSPHPRDHDRASRAGHVLLQPLIDPERTARLGLPMETRLIVAQAAVRLLAEQLLADPDAQPAWFAEGAAQWAAEEGFAAAGWLPDRMEEPLFSNHAVIVRGMVEHGVMPSLTVIVAGLPGGLSSVERPAVAGAVYRFLKDPARADVFARVSTAADAFDFTAEAEARMVAALGDEAVAAALEAAFSAWARTLEPGWVEPVPSLSTSTEAWPHVAPPAQDAVAWRMLPAHADRYVIAGEFEILPGGGEQMSVLLAGAAHEHVQVAFKAGRGIDVLHFADDVPAAEAWVKLATVEVKGLRTGRSIPFEIVVDGTQVSVSVAGQPACHAAIPARAAAGRWGLGVQAGSAGLWRKIGFGRL